MTVDDAQFEAWEREALFWLARGSAGGHTDDEPDLIVERDDHDAAHRYLCWLDAERLRMLHELGGIRVHEGETGVYVRADRFAQMAPKVQPRAMLRAAGVSLEVDPPRFTG